MILVALIVKQLVFEVVLFGLRFEEVGHILSQISVKGSNIQSS